MREKQIWNKLNEKSVVKRGLKDYEANHNRYKDLLRYSIECHDFESALIKDREDLLKFICNVFGISQTLSARLNILLFKSESVFPELQKLRDELLKMEMSLYKKENKARLKLKRLLMDIKDKEGIISALESLSNEPFSLN